MARHWGDGEQIRFWERRVRHSTLESCTAMGEPGEGDQGILPSLKHLK